MMMSRLLHCVTAVRGLRGGGGGEGRRQGGASKKKKRRESDEEPAVPRYLWHTPVNVSRERREVRPGHMQDMRGKMHPLMQPV